MNPAPEPPPGLVRSATRATRVRLGAWGVGVAVFVAALASGCASMPPPVSKTHTSALSDTEGTHLARVVAPLLAQHPGQAGIVPLPDGLDAFAARVQLIDAAERSIDLQTYILHDDATGTLMVARLLAAADRGVRVRLLLDDNNTVGLDPLLRLLDEHPHIEVRLFNPFAQRHLRLGALLADFERLNRRMHNKSLTVDNSATIVGGRNIGDAYFESHLATSFADLDVVIVGDAVREVSAVFDLYWNSDPAYPAAALLAGTTALDRDVFDIQVREALDTPEAAPHRALSPGGSGALRALLAGESPPSWASVRLVHDDPDKVMNPPDRTDVQLLPRLQIALGSPQRSLDIVSPYFVPGEIGTATLAAMASRGVQVRVLTNSLAATDVAMVHAGYAKRRETLLRAGIRLFELKPLPDARATLKGPSGSRVPGGNSRASLHAKTFAVDGERVFVGSLNFDPRSARLNTEMGMVIASPALAAQLSTTFDQAVPAHAFELRLSPEGQLQWVDTDGTVRTREPAGGLFRRLAVEVLSWFPIEWLL